VAKVENLDTVPNAAYKVSDKYWAFGGHAQLTAPYMTGGYKNHMLMFCSNYWLGVL
jgi:hypothetical protein